MSELTSPALPMPVADFGVTGEIIVPCSMHTCVAGHTWSPKLALVGCPGCSQSMLAILMVNCPICNEPTKSTKIRADHLTQGGAITPMCKGSGTLAESVYLTLEHTHAQTEQDRHQEKPVAAKL